MTTGKTTAGTRRTTKRAAAPRKVVQPRVLTAEQQDDGAFAVPEEVYDLDALRHEAKDERFRFKAAGRIWDLLTPEECDWRDMSTLTERASGVEDMRPSVEMLLAGQYEDFLEIPLSMAQINTLFAQWRDWHGIDLGESGASRRS